MRLLFKDNPDAWLRAPRIYQSRAQYGSAIERFQRKGHSVAPVVGGVILAVLGFLVITGRL